MKKEVEIEFYSGISSKNYHTDEPLDDELVYIVQFDEETAGETGVYYDIYVTDLEPTVEEYLILKIGYGHSYFVNNEDYYKGSIWTCVDSDEVVKYDDVLKM